MAQPSPFIAASPGALQHLTANPLVQQALKQGIYKDIWGSEYQGFMGMDSGGGGPMDEIQDSPSGRNRAFSADVTIYRCVDIRGAATASVPFKIYDQADPNKRKEVKHEALDVLQATNPYNYCAGPTFWKYFLGSRDLHGSGAAQLVFDRGGKLRDPLPREIYWLPPAQYRPVRGKDLNPPQPKVPFAGLKVRDGRQETFIPANQLIYAPTYNPSDPIAGTSKITALRNEINLRGYGQQSNLWFFRNNQRPDVVVTGAFSPSTENVNLMRRIWKAAFGGDGNRGPAFLPHDMSVHLLTVASKDAEWLGQQHAAREDILAAFGVPPPVYGDLSRATYENIRTAYQGFWQSSMIPEMDELSWFLTQQFLWRWPDAAAKKYVFGFDYAAIEALQEDANAIWERVMQMMDRLTKAMMERALLPNQFRAMASALFKMAGLPTGPWAGQVPGGDMFYVRALTIPVNEASVQAQIDIAGARAGDLEAGTNSPGNGSWSLPDHIQPPPPPAPVTPPPQAPPPQPPPVTQSVTVIQPPETKEVTVKLGDTTNQFAQPEMTPQVTVNVQQPEAKVLPLQGSVTKADLPHETIRDNRLKSAEDWLTRRFKRYFQDQQVLALRAVRSGKAIDYETASPEVVLKDIDPDGLWSMDEWRTRAGEIVREGIVLSAVAAYASAAADYGLGVELGTARDPWVDQYMGSRLGLIRGIDDTTRKAIRATLLEGAQEGETIGQLARRVRDVFADAIDYRALRIARTETIQAYGLASLAAYRDAGITMAVMYDGSGDAGCSAVNGRQVSIEEAQRLMLQEHPNGRRGVSPMVNTGAASDSGGQVPAASA